MQIVSDNKKQIASLEIPLKIDGFFKKNRSVQRVFLNIFRMFIF
jgi:hypothetical protein